MGQDRAPGGARRHAVGARRLTGCRRLDRATQYAAAVQVGCCIDRQSGVDNGKVLPPFKSWLARVLLQNA